MFLKLIESRRARVIAGWALGLSVGAHAGWVGGWVESQRRGVGDGTSAHEGPISVRYLLPLDHEAATPGERIEWVAVGVHSSGWVQGAPVTPEADRRQGDATPHEASEPPDGLPGGDVPDETRIFTAEDVDSVAARDPTSDGPRYPDELRTKGVQGEALVEFTVDTTGLADPESFSVVEATHPLFADAVREALPRMHFSPAVSHGHRVRQLVRLPMKFRLVTPPSARGTATD